jgi:hypothetical protein
MYICVHAHTSTCTYIHAYIHRGVIHQYDDYKRIVALQHTHTHTYTHTHIHTHTHTYKHIYIHTYTEA